MSPSTLGAGGAFDAGADASRSAAPSGGDALVENGLGSPLCGAEASDLSAGARRNCATSGFEAASAPTGNYALDVHIDTGALGFTMSTIEQDYLIGPVWMGLVWVVHTLVVALEWCFTLDLLDSSAMGAVERALREAQASFTRPWLVLALALASLLVAYNGLVRRRVAQTVGQAALALAMMACGLWVIFDPLGTVGALGRWVDEASIGTVGSVASGSPAQAPQTLAENLQGLFAGVVGAPWCYLEFGNVRWCAEPRLLDRPLDRAGLALAGAASGGCARGSSSAALCEVVEAEQPQSRARSATLLRAARTNGELFLALPANAPARNSINDHASLLRVLCGGVSATDCPSATAAEAEFRTQGGTFARLGGLLLIVLGALGMLLLLGFIALHLLGAELLGLLYLLLAPAAVIAPALGEGGRAVFRSWAGRLLGAVTSKLLFSFLLGVVLLLTRILLEFDGLGWWSRWLLLSALWWGAYCQRRRALDFFHGELGGARTPQRLAGDHGGSGGHRAPGRHGPTRHEPVTRRVQRQLESPLAAVRATKWVRGALARPAPAVEPRGRQERTGPAHMSPEADLQATRMLACEYEHSRAELADAPRIQTELGEKRGQLQRVRSAHRRAEAAGQTRQRLRLQARALRVEGEIGQLQTRLSGAQEIASRGRRGSRATGRPYRTAEVVERSRFLDAQALLPAAGRAGAGAGAGVGVGVGVRPRGAQSAADAPRRDYAALAALVGYGRGHYERLDPSSRLQVRANIDRALARRRELNAPALPAAGGDRAEAREGRRRGGEGVQGDGERLPARTRAPAASAVVAPPPVIGESAPMR